MSDAAEGRLAPLKPEEWDASLAEVLADLKNPLSIHNVVARNPVLMANYVDFRNHIVKSSSLSGRQRELIILRVAHNTACAYEWDHHVVRGRDAGLQDHEIAFFKFRLLLFHDKHQLRMARFLLRYLDTPLRLSVFPIEHPREFLSQQT